MVSLCARYFATLYYEVDKGVGPEEFEDLEGLVEPGKQPLDHDTPLLFIDKFSVCMMTLLIMSLI